MLKLSVLIIAIALGNVNGMFEKRNSVIDKGSHILVCEQEPIELGIVLDSSSSIRRDDFQRGKDFLIEFLDQFDIGQGKNDVRVSIITFGRGIYPRDGFNLTTYDDKAALLEAVNLIPHRAGPYTDTGRGIEYMHKYQLSKDVVRPYAEKVGLVITDGNSQNWRATERSAAAARADNITMFAVGIGSARQVKENELLRIAGDIERVTRVESYSSLTSVKELLAKKTCIKKQKPTTIPPMKMEVCGVANPADINFVFSPMDLGIDAVAWSTSFIAHTVDTDDMDQGFRFGLITGDCPSDAGFSLDKYNNVADIRDRLEDYDRRTRLPGLAQQLIDYGYSVENGGRPGTGKVAVFFADGAKGMKGDELQAKVKELSEDGVKVYIANPAGYPIEIEGAVALSGRSSRQQSEEFVNLLCGQIY